MLTSFTEPSRRRRAGGSAARHEPARRDGERGVADDLGVFDWRLPPLQQAAEMNHGQEPTARLDELEERSVALGVTPRADTLKTNRRRYSPEAAAEVETDIRLRLAPPSKGPRPPVRIQE